MRSSLLIIFFLSLTAESEEWSDTPSYIPSCNGSYSSYWSKEQKLSDVQIPLTPPHIDDVNEAEKAFQQCNKILPSRYSTEEIPNETIKWFMQVECMNSKGWFFKISSFNSCLSNKNDI